MSGYTATIRTRQHKRRQFVNRYSTWGGYRTEVRQYTQGTLAIDLVDAAQNILVWEGVAQQRVGRSTTGLSQEQANDVIGQVMTEFAHTAR